MTKPASTFPLTRQPLVDKDGNPTFVVNKTFRDWDVKLENGLSAIGDFIGNLDPTVQIVGKPGTVGTITSHIDSVGVMTGGGVDFAQPYLNKDTDHIADGTGNPLAGGKAAYLALVTNAPVANGLLEWDGGAWHWIQRPQTIGAVASNWVRSFDQATGLFTASQPAFTDVSGAATAAQVPPLSSLTGQITAGQLPAAGISGTAVLAKLTALGTNGSLAFANGQITGYVAPS